MKVSQSALSLAAVLAASSLAAVDAFGPVAPPSSSLLSNSRGISRGSGGGGGVGMSVSPMEDTGQASASSSSSSFHSVGGMSQSRTGRSQDEIEVELSEGRILEGGQTIDFASVKDEGSKGEIALAAAREELTKSMSSGNSAAVSAYSAAVANAEAGGRLMGINDDVVREVGGEVGQFAATDFPKGTVQGCAAYLRSRAPPGTFEADPNAPSSGGSSGSDSFSEEQIADFDSLLSKAYDESGVVTEAFAKTFYLGTKLMPEEAQRAIWAIYVWCRRTDEIVDAPRKPDDPDMLTDLSAWELRTENLWKYGEVVDVLDLPLLDVRIRYPNLEIVPFVDMIRGMLMDIPGLGQDRYDTFDELHLYCYRVAGTVGLMSMPIFGCAPGYTDEQAKEPALSLGVAFQITNILRDVGEDATTRGRVYLPQKDMERFGVTEQQLFEQRVDENYVNLMKYEIERARMYYDRAKRGVPMLSPESRLPVQSSLDCYGKILDKIEENGYDSLNQRAYVSKWEKLFEIPFSWYRTQEISKVLPLPWDPVRPADAK